jgi:hypothetical protein
MQARVRGEDKIALKGSQLLKQASEVFELGLVREIAC